MRPSRRASQDAVSLSFIDVLTCVLGAAIALFLIFVALTRLSAQASTSEGSARDHWHRRAAAVQGAQSPGRAGVVLRVVSSEEAVVAHLHLQPSPNRVQRLEARTSDGQALYGRLYHFDEGLAGSEVLVSMARGGPSAGRLSTMLAVGGAVEHSDVDLNSVKLPEGRRALFSLRRVGPPHLRLEAWVP